MRRSAFALTCLTLFVAAIGRGAGDAPEAGIQWVRLPAGTFTMGSDSLGAKGPAHRVTIRAFEMARTLVTNKQYKACMRAGACTAPADKGERFDGDDQPVVGVSWSQAKAFSKWVGGRLPSEAEWEYAARSAGRDIRFPWGNEAPACDRAVFLSCAPSTLPVCSRPKGNTDQGLCDMLGNAQEWIQDRFHDSYVGAPSDGGDWEVGGHFRVTRGSPWNAASSFSDMLQSRMNDPFYRFYYFGIRPVR